MGIKSQGVAYVRFSAPDLDEMEAFLTEFGMARAERSGDALYMRGLDENPFLHESHLGEHSSPQDSRRRRWKTSKRSREKRRRRSIV